jgi:hypothetical protein
MIGDPVGRQQGAEQLLGLPQADAHRLGGDYEPLQGRVVDGDGVAALSPELLQLLPQLIAGELGLLAPPLLVLEALPEAAGLVVERLPRAAGLVRPRGDRAVAAAEDGSDIAKKGGNG